MGLSNIPRLFSLRRGSLRPPVIKTVSYQDVFPPHHERFVDGVSELEGVVTDGQVVLQSERLQHDAVSYGESQTQVVTGVSLKGGEQRWC